jgi:replicative DNA helicase
MLSNTLKEIAAENNVFIQSGTQLNDRWQKNLVRNVNHVRGSKAIGDKVDVGIISVMLSDVPEEKEKAEKIVEAANVPMPNIVVDVYKNRRGPLTGVKLFRHFDYGTCRVKDIMLTSSSFKVINDYEVVEYEQSTLSFSEYDKMVVNFNE